MTIPASVRVCLVTGTYLPVTGGGETQARTLAEGLVARGHQVTLLTRRSRASFPARERVGNVCVYRLPLAGAGQLRKWSLLFSVGPALVRLRRDYDQIIVSGFQAPGLPAVIAARLLGKRVILKADSLGEMSGAYFSGGLARVRMSTRSWPFRAFLSLRNALIRKADAFVAISGEIASELTAGGVPPQKIWRIPNSVDAEHFTPVDVEARQALRRGLGIPRQARVAVYTGRLVTYKGLPLLLRVWQEIAATRRDAYLLVVGSGGDDMYNCEQALRQTVRQARLEGSVCLTGAVEDVRPYLQASDVFVFPTENEAFGISLVEAMACGLPAVTTDIGGLKDIVAHGHNGLIIQPGDGYALREALDRLFDDAALRRRLGLAARQTVEERFTTERVLEQYIELFRSESC